MNKVGVLKSNSTIKQKVIIVVTLVALFGFFTILRPNFASYENIMNIVLSTCVNGILAIGITFVIITAGIDLSLGTMMTFTTVVSGIAFTIWGVPIWMAIAIGFGTGILCGTINGFAIAKMGLPPFIATLSMMMITKGLSLIISGIKPVYFSDAPVYREIALGNAFGISGFYTAILIFVAIIIIAHVLLSKTIFGRYTFALGSNEESARLSGVKVEKWKIIVYGFCGLMTAVAGLIMSSRLNSAQPQLGSGYEMEAIAAAVIGGASLSGGEGGIFGTAIGAFIMSVLTNGLRIMQVSQEWQSVVIGIVLAFAVYMDQIRRRKRSH